MSYLQSLLSQSEPLSAAEREDLERWLATLQEDILMFGSTAEDEARVRTIKAKLAQQS